MVVAVARYWRREIFLFSMDCVWRGDILCLSVSHLVFFSISPCRAQQRSRCLYVQVFNFLCSRASFFFSFLSLSLLVSLVTPRYSPLLPSFCTACSFIPWLTVYSLEHTHIHTPSLIYTTREKERIKQQPTHTYPSHFLPSSLSLLTLSSNLSDPSHGGLHSQCSGLQGSLRQALRQAQRCRPRGREVSD